MSEPLSAEEQKKLRDRTQKTHVEALAGDMEDELSWERYRAATRPSQVLRLFATIDALTTERDEAKRHAENWKRHTMERTRDMERIRGALLDAEKERDELKALLPFVAAAAAEKQREACAKGYGLGSYALISDVPTPDYDAVLSQARREKGGSDG